MQHMYPYLGTFSAYIFDKYFTYIDLLEALGGGGGGVGWGWVGGGMGVGWGWGGGMGVGGWDGGGELLR